MLSDTYSLLWLTRLISLHAANAIPQTQLRTTIAKPCSAKAHMAGAANVDDIAMLVPVTVSCCGSRRGPGVDDQVVSCDTMKAYVLLNVAIYIFRGRTATTTERQDCSGIIPIIHSPNPLLLPLVRFEVLLPYSQLRRINVLL